MGRRRVGRLIVTVSVHKCVLSDGAVLSIVQIGTCKCQFNSYSMRRTESVTC
jgi:hypothetical protein